MNKTKMLLELGFCVIETRPRKENKELSLWSPICAFANENDAEFYFTEFGSIGSMRILYPPL